MMNFHYINENKIITLLPIFPTGFPRLIAEFLVCFRLIQPSIFIVVFKKYPEKPTI